jgi:SWI/SNF-related matrix-associated actin-dependent regulator of chromatin subfamily A member 5
MNQVTTSAQRERRARTPVVYAVSSGSDDSPAPSSPSDFVASPNKVRQDFPNNVEDENDDDDGDDEEKDETDELAPLPETRSIEGGRTLRPRSVLKSAPKTGINYQPRRKYTKKAVKMNRKLAHSQSLTAREKVRDAISKGTQLQQDRFLLAHKNVFLPLLQEGNYVSKLQGHSPGMETPFVEYKDIPHQPQGVKATMKPYQLRGLSFLVHLYNNGMPGILGDEMGLGKTLQTLSLFQYLKEQDLKSRVSAGEARPFLVVAPLSVLSNWVAEARKFTPGLKVLRFHGPTSERAQMKDIALGRTGSARPRTKGASSVTLSSDVGRQERYDLIVTTYEAYLAEQSWFKQAFVWRYLVLDEGHKIKNHSTNVSKALQGLRAEYRLLLTGTPLQNNLSEMWSLLHWLLPNVFTAVTEALFKTSFDLSRGMVNKGVLDHSRHFLELLMLRRMKDTPDVDLNLPPKTEVRLFLPLTPLQKQWYTRLLTRQSENVLDEVFRGATDKEKDAVGEEIPDRALDSSLWDVGKEEPSQGNKTQWQRLLNLVMQLRKCCTHPYLIPDAAPNPNFIGEHIAQASGKFMALEKLVRELVIRQGKKILIFSNFTQVLDWCEDLMTHLSEYGTEFKHLRLDGSTKRARRNLHIRMFQDVASEFKVMLISTKAGGLGLNLTAATEAVFLDEDWNPQVDLQAEARCHRIGQTKPVTVYKLCTQGTVEEQMLGRISKKLYLSARITDSMQSVHDSPSRKKKGPNANIDDEQQAVLGNFNQLKSLLRRGAQTLVHKQIDIQEMVSWDMETLLLNTRDKSGEAVTNDEHADEDKWLSTMEKVECAVFDGQRYERKGRVEDVDVLPCNVSRQDRRVGKNTTVMIDGYAVSKDTVGNADWEAVATFAGKDPRLAERKRGKKVAINNQEVGLSECAQMFTVTNILS